MATAFVFVLLFGPTMIDRLRECCRAKASRFCTDGPKSHHHQDQHADDGRPDDPCRHRRIRAAVGNLRSGYVWIVMLVTLGFGAVCFHDDYLKVTKQSHAWVLRDILRLGIEAAIALIAAS